MNETCVVKARHGFFEKSMNYSLSVFGTAFFEKAVKNTFRCRNVFLYFFYIAIIK
jgi:hypothetical protein